MCGIVGKINPHGAVDPMLLDRMCEAVEHRGPDARGVFNEGGVALGIQRLAVIDLETGNQPIKNEDESLVVVLNGEIYNYQELRSDLESRGHRFRSESDTEVIVHLYEDHGDKCVNYLRGMFAFALWDQRRRRLLIGRDRVGKKPLFYGHRPDGTFWFASEPRAILQDSAVPRDVNWESIDSFLRFKYVPDPLSAFAALRKLPPAHVLVWEDGEIDISRYWRLSYANPIAVGDIELGEMVREQLLDATRLRLRSDVPVGAFLSGGVDSGAVVAAMAMECQEPVRTFAIGFDVEGFDETEYARLVSDRYGTVHEELRVESDAVGILPELVWHYGEPFADQSAVPSLYLAQMTSRHVKVALNGDGGDENFAGYRRYVAQTVTDRLRHLPRPLARQAARLLELLGSSDRPNSPQARAWRVLYGASLEPWESYEMYMSTFRPGDLDRIYAPGFRASEDPLDTPSPIRARWKASDATDLVNRLLDVDVGTWLPGDLLVKMDIATMAHSLEVRSPLLDHVFMEHAARIPGSVKLKGARTKHIFKEAVRPWLPSQVVDRPKMGFSVPLAEWMRGPLRGLASDVLLDPAAKARGIFSTDRVTELIDQHERGRCDNSEQLWSLLQLELWFRTYVDVAIPTPVSFPLNKPA